MDNQMTFARTDAVSAFCFWNGRWMIGIATVEKGVDQI